jgi:hypothetical protein
MYKYDEEMRLKNIRRKFRMQNLQLNIKQMLTHQDQFQN